MLRVLVADDDPGIVRTLMLGLKMMGCQPVGVESAEAAIKALEEKGADLLLTDMRMEGMSGVELVRDAHARWPEMICVVMTAFASYENAVSAIKAGAYDYLPKPFSMKELLARIRAMTRRQTDTTDNVLAFGDIALNRSTYQLTGPENPEGIRLAGKEYQMLEMLMSNPGQVISPDLFMDKIWGYDSEAEQNVVWVYISYLRKKLTSIGSQVKIRAARGLGYSLEKDNA